MKSKRFIAGLILGAFGFHMIIPQPIFAAIEEMANTDVKVAEKSAEEVKVQVQDKQAQVIPLQELIGGNEVKLTPANGDGEIQFVNFVDPDAPKEEIKDPVVEQRRQQFSLEVTSLINRINQRVASLDNAAGRLADENLLKQSIKDLSNSLLAAKTQIITTAQAASEQMENGHQGDQALKYVSNYSKFVLGPIEKLSAELISYSQKLETISKAEKNAVKVFKSKNLLPEVAPWINEFVNNMKTNYLNAYINTLQDLTQAAIMSLPNHFSNSPQVLDNAAPLGPILTLNAADKKNGNDAANLARHFLKSVIHFKNPAYAPISTYYDGGAAINSITSGAVNAAQMRQAAINMLDALFHTQLPMAVNKAMQRPNPNTTWFSLTEDSILKVSYTVYALSQIQTQAAFNYSPALRVSRMAWLLYYMRQYYAKLNFDFGNNGLGQLPPSPLG